MESSPNTRQLAGALITIALLALVVPPVLATRLNAHRVERAREAVTRLAALVASRAATADDGGYVLAGDGSRPAVVSAGWDLASARPLEPVLGAAVAADPWGNQYIVFFEAPTRARGLVLCAGPNGQINTDFGDGRVTPAGDDLIALW